MRTVAIVVAAGPGTRLNAELPKAFVRLGGTPLVIHSLRALLAAPAISGVVTVMPPDRVEEGRALLRGHGPWRCTVSVTAGGTERQDSVRMGLAAIEDADLIAVHDAARPFVTADAVARVIAAAAEAGGAILALPASDTVKEVDEAREIRATLDRRRLWLAQTPQVFRLDLLRAAHARAQLDRLTATDDAALVERLGVGVRVVPCDSSNRKITTPEDLLWAEWQLARGRAPR